MDDAGQRLPDGAVGRALGWLATVATALGAVVLFPSVSSLYLLLAALVACPEQHLRALPPFAQLHARLPQRLLPVLVGFLCAAGLLVSPAVKDNVMTLAGQTAKRMAPASEPDDPFAGVRLVRTTEVLEYAQKEIDPTTLVSCSDAEVTLTAEPLCLATCGKRQVTFCLTKADATTTVTKTYTVRDTKPPQVELVDTAFSLDYGSSFDPFAVVRAVSDPVDGNLRRVDVRPTDDGEGWYTVEGSYDAFAAGRYYFMVVAHDRHGNETKKEFFLEVKEAPDAADEAHDYVINTRSGKFHLPTCYDVGQMSESNTWRVHMSRSDVIEMGYAPCQHCCP